MVLFPLKSQESWWDRLNELEQIQTEMNRMFNLTLSRQPRQSRALFEGSLSPAVDVFDSKDAVLVKAEIPGMTKDDIEATVQGDTLTIKGEKKLKTEENSSVRREREYGAFIRTIPLGSEIDTGKITATCRNGVLELTLPKKEEAKPKQIMINVK